MNSNWMASELYDHMRDDEFRKTATFNQTTISRWDRNFWRSFGAREKCETNACDVVLWFFQTNKFNRCISFLVFFIFSIIKCMQLTSEQVSRASRDESSCRRTRWCLAEKIHELRYYFETNLLRNILCNGPNRNGNENIWMKSNTFNAIDCFVKLVVINCMWIKSDDII